ncbi:MAG: glycosyltransferase family 39 protein [Chloroflexota bacterium]
MDRFPFREDEAVYGLWAIHFLQEDRFFLTLWPDKPPLFIWLLSTTFALLGISEWSARWLNLMLSTLLIPVIAGTARRAWGNTAAIFAAITVAFNPYAISFAATVYTDPQLLLTGALSLFMAVLGRPLYSGLWLGAAIMTKQQGILYLPLILGTLWFSQRGRYSASTHPEQLREGSKNWLKVTAGTLVIILPILYWDSLRWAVAPSPWDLSIRNYESLTLLPPTAWWSRLQEWGRWLSYLVGLEADSQWIADMMDPASWVGSILSIGLVVAIWQRRRKHSIPISADLLSSLPSLLLLWSVGFLFLHVMTSVEIWDRYLLPLVLPFALGVGWAGGSITSYLSLPNRLIWIGQSFILRMLILCWFLLLLPPAAQAARGQIPIGGDHGAFSGLHQALAWLEAENQGEPYVLYHQQLGAQFRFYLYEPVAHGQVDLRWYPHPVYLVNNSRKIPNQRKFLLQPEWASPRSLALHAQVGQVDLHELANLGRFQVIELVPHYPESCDWCLCRLPIEWPTGWSRLK